LIPSTFVTTIAEARGVAPREVMAIPVQILWGSILGLPVAAAALHVWRFFVGRYELGLGLERGAQTTGQALVLLAMALLGGYSAWRWNSVGATLSTLVVTGLLLAVTLVDLQVRRIPNALVGILAAWCLLQIAWMGWPTIPAALLGAAVGGGVFFLLYLLSRGAMGAGDVKFVAATGLLVGYPLIASSMFLGIVAGGLAALALLLTGKASRKDSIAYGPYLALGAWVVWFVHALMPGLLGA